MIRVVNLAEVISPAKFEALGGAEGAVQGLLENIMEGARAEWVRLAKQNLHTTRSDYVRGILPVEMQPGVGSITLIGTLPNVIEQGLEAMDMHDTLLGPDVPVGRPGKQESKKHPGNYYRSIPIRHGTPTSTTVAPPMGSQYGGLLGPQGARTLGRKVYAAAKALSGTVGQPGGPTRWGERLPAGMAPILKPNYRASPLPRRVLAPHSVDLYASMYRMEKLYASRVQSYYMTFRTISDLVPDKWHRRATEGQKLCEKVVEYIEKTAPDVINAFIEEANRD